MTIHMMNKSYDAICGARGSCTSTRYKKKVTCIRCLEKLGLKDPDPKPDVKSGLFIPSDPSRKGSNAS